jgi:transcription termination factor NusB
MISSKTIARLACVQAIFLYEYGERLQDFEEITDCLLSYYNGSDVIDDFRGHKVSLHRNYFLDLCNLILQHLVTIEEHLEGMFHGKTELLNISIIKVGVCEMLYKDKVPAKVIVNEFANISASFGFNPAIVNSILDKISTSSLRANSQNLA